MTSRTLGEALDVALHYFPLVLPTHELYRVAQGKRGHVHIQRLHRFGSPYDEILSEMIPGGFHQMLAFANQATREAGSLKARSCISATPPATVPNATRPTTGAWCVSVVPTTVSSFPARCWSARCSPTTGPPRPWRGGPGASVLAHRPGTAGVATGTAFPQRFAVARTGAGHHGGRRTTGNIAAHAVAPPAGGRYDLRHPAGSRAQLARRAAAARQRPAAGAHRPATGLQRPVEFLAGIQARSRSAAEFAASTLSGCR